MQRLSVAMCTYNGTQYLREQLDSVADQTRRPNELVVCDDGSSDDTVEILAAFASTAPFPVHVHLNEENLGSTRNFDKAIEFSEGEIIVLCDQDDVWHLEKLNRIETLLSASPSFGAVFCDAEVVDTHLQPLGYGLWESLAFSEREKNHVMNGRAVEVLLRHNVVAGAAMAFRADYKELVLPIPESWVHDAWIALLIASVAELGMIREPLIKYRQHSGNLIGAHAINNWKEFEKQVTTDKKDDKDKFVRRERRYRALLERLTSARKPRYSSEAIAKIEAKVSHLRVRSQMPQQIFHRIPLVLRELITLRYHRYSKGLYSCAKDLFF